MRQVGKFIRAIVGRMLRALLIWAVVVGGITVSIITLSEHKSPNVAEWFLIGMVTVLAGALGMALTLAWELTHIPHILRHVNGLPHQPPPDDMPAIEAPSDKPERNRARSRRAS